MKLKFPTSVRRLWMTKRLFSKANPTTPQNYLDEAQRYQRQYNFEYLPATARRKGNAADMTPLLSRPINLRLILQEHATCTRPATC